VNRYRAYGLDIACEQLLPLRQSHGASEPDLRFLYSGVSPAKPSSGPDRRDLQVTEAGWALRYDNRDGGWMIFEYSARDWHVRVSGSVPWEECVGPLCGLVCGLFLRLAGATLLHGACLKAGDEAFAILGASGQGKSTLAGALIGQGAELITEDLLVFRHTSEGYFAEPGAPTLHLGPDSYESLFPGLEDAGRTVRMTGDGKIRLILPWDRKDGVAPVLLSAIFILRPGVPVLTSLERLSGARAVSDLTEHLYGQSWMRPTDSSDLEFCARLARQVPIFAVLRPWALDEVAETATLLQRCAQQYPHHAE